MSGGKEAPRLERRITDNNSATLALRVDGLERRMETVEFDLKNNTRELRANTVLTQQAHTMIAGVKDDTATIVAATKWMSTSKRLTIGLGVFCGAIVAVLKAAHMLGLLQ